MTVGFDGVQQYLLIRLLSTKTKLLQLSYHIMLPIYQGNSNLYNMRSLASLDGDEKHPDTFLTFDK